ncbi:MAG: hypothetical protein QM778_14550 [Myxococcales bacterium]
MSFADLKPTLNLRKPVADATVSLAETPARVQVSSARASAPAPRPRAAQSKTLFGLPTVAMPGQEKPAPKAGEPAASKPEPAVTSKSQPKEAPAAVAAPSSTASVGAPTASAAAPSGAVQPAGLPAPGPRASLPSVATAEKPPAQGIFAADTPARTSPLPPPPQAAVTQRESQVQVRANSREAESDRTQDVSLGELSPADADAPSVAPAMRAANELEDLPAATLERRHVPSTEPAPRPRSALGYGLAAAIPVALAAAWFTWRLPVGEPTLPNATEVALKSEQKVELAAPAPVQPSEPVAPAALEAPRAEASAAAVAAAAEPVPSEPAAGAVDPQAEAPAPPADAPTPEGEAAAPAATDSASGAVAEADPDAEDADVEIDASRKAVAGKANKLVNEGHALRRKKKLAPARAKYRDALALYPGYPRALAGLVQVAILQRDGKAAVNLAKQLVKLRPAQVSYQVLLGDAYKAAGKPGLAKDAWQGAARKGSTTAKARLED